MSVKLFNSKSECSGCWACYNICQKSAIEMVSDNEGFKFPQIREECCIECGLCIKVCPLKTSAKQQEAENESKHIGIINLQFTQNYGAVIAAAVLEDTVRDIAGAEYRVNSVQYVPWKPLKSRYLELMDEAKQWGGWKLYLKARFNSSNESEANAVRSKRFNVFRDRFLNLTPYYDDASKINEAINYSAFITGSDVVWAPKRTDNYRSEGYYLKFANKGERRIAYAPSLDNRTDGKLKKLKSIYKDNLEFIDCVSVREKGNLDFIQSLTDKKVSVCCDPAFLVEPDYYDKMISAANVGISSEKYIYVYILEINQDIVDYANKLAREKGLKICYYSANQNDYISNSENCMSDGPSEFLYRLKNAEYVLTNSYHCVVFSILFKKRFLSFKRSKVSIKASDLLDTFGLTDRIVNGKDIQDIDRKIDFFEIDKKREEIKNSSLEYLKNALADLD